MVCIYSLHALYRQCLVSQKNFRATELWHYKLWQRALTCPPLKWTVTCGLAYRLSPWSAIVIACVQHLYIVFLPPIWMLLSYLFCWSILNHIELPTEGMQTDVPPSLVQLPNIAWRRAWVSVLFLVLCFFVLISMTQQPNELECYSVSAAGFDACIGRAHLILFWKYDSHQMNCNESHCTLCTLRIMPDDTAHQSTLNLKSAPTLRPETRIPTPSI